VIKCLQACEGGIKSMHTIYAGQKVITKVSSFIYSFAGRDDKEQ
jgi:hypothetical protein